MRQGVVPCSPIHPTAAVTIGSLELFRIARLRSPHFSIQAFIKTLCDLQGVVFQRYLSCQFSIAFDLYLQLHGRVDSIVSQVLQRDSEDWQLKHACAACTYQLTDEPELKFKLLYAMDGNDSLKCVLRRLPDEIADNHRLSRDLLTGQVLTSSPYMSHEYVNKFAMVGSKDPIPNVDSDPNPCAGRWKNMDNAKTKKIWGVYDETGIFMAVCHHGTCLLIAEMVQSGECAKYPLATVSKLMAAFSDGLGSGYNIGCQFQTTLATSTLRPQARDLNHTCLVGVFHGHAHHRLCQLSHLTLYVEGLGLEDLETCKCTFSKSNALASTVRYATTFHRQQAINAYFEHNDTFEIYANLTNFLFNNYKQVLTIIHDSKAVLTNLKHDLSIDDEGIFHRWLEEEKKYLEGLSREPLEDTLHMESWEITRLESSVSNHRLNRDMRVHKGNQMVVSKRPCRREKAKIRGEDHQGTWSTGRGWGSLDSSLAPFGRPYPSLLLTQGRHRCICNPVCISTDSCFAGYKLWKHIAKALQTHSAAIKVALERYNKCALAMRPPRQTLQWEQVVEYAFLANFDLLQDMHEDISKCPWAHPSARFALDTYFKICAEPRRRSNALTSKSVKSSLIYMHDEERFLRMCKEKINTVHPTPAHQVSQCRSVIMHY
ncbi:hypothetical protein EDD15DRAFT_2173014 [Pisolithus albus]|nr:hypothetical protein EDD15DRAFT_2173014 [Pisolithus albus]